MANESSSSFFSSVSPQQIAALLTFVTSAVLMQVSPLQSRREMEASSTASATSDDHKFAASHVEDPLAAVKTQKVVDPDVKEFDPLTQVKAFSHWGFFSEELRDSAREATPDRRVQVICSLLRPGNDQFSCEQRHRARLAVVSALATMGYVPVATRGMEVCRLQNVTKDNPGRYVGEWELGEDRMDVPFEWFTPSSSLPKVCQQRFSRICVLWFDSDHVLGRVGNPRPIDRLRRILHALLTGYPRPVVPSNSLLPGLPPLEFDPALVETVVLGPHDSGTLAVMLKEAQGKASKKKQRWDQPLWMVSPYATASAEALLRTAGLELPAEFRVAGQEGQNGLGCKLYEQQVQRWMNRALSGVPAKEHAEPLFLRTVLTDDHVSEALVAELEKRNITFPQKAAADKQAKGCPPPGDIVLISEFDTSYGRELPLSFLAAARVEGGADVFTEPNGHWHWTTFPRGLDGRFGAVAAAAEGANAKKKEDGKTKSTPPGDEPRGTNQMDALRRLARQLVELHESRLNQEQPGIVAVGMLGGDVYDKMLVFRALRTLLKDTVFFTNNLDAWLWDDEELPTTKNLIVASPFDLRLGDHWQAGKAPFRDSYQTSVYAATLALVGGKDFTELRSQLAFEAVVDCHEELARLFEIGRDGPVALSFPRRQGGKELHPTHHVELSVFGTGDAVLVRWQLFGLICGFFIIWVVASNHTLRFLVGQKAARGAARPRAATGFDSTVWEKPLLMLAKHPAWPFVGAVFALLVSNVLWEGQRAVGEPLSLRSGTSGWFFFITSFVAALLGAHLIVKSLIILWEGERDVQNGYFGGSKKLPQFGWGGARGLFLIWPSNDISRELNDRPYLNPQPLWLAFRRSGLLAPRLIRAAFTTGAIWLGMHLLSTLDPHDFMPVRGASARAMCSTAEALSLLAFISLSMLIFDSLWLNRIFIDWFGKGTTLWKWGQLKLEQTQGIKRRQRCDYTDLRLIADWTRDIGRLTALPFYVLGMVVLARLSYFDAWRWPWHVGAGLVLTAALVILGSYRVHTAAIKLRQEALAHLRADHRALDDKAPVKVLIDKVQQLSHGAFMPFLKQPVMEAVYWFVSAVSVTGLLQQLSQMLS